MEEVLTISSVAGVIQLSVAPVFLLSGVGAILAVMSNRLARVVDRARVLETRIDTTEGPAGERLRRDLQTLAVRARTISRAIALCTLAALLVCAVVITLFLGAFLNFNAALPVALFFGGAMLAFVAGLTWFLREIFLASTSLRIGPPA